MTTYAIVQAVTVWGEKGSINQMTHEDKGHNLG